MRSKCTNCGLINFPNHPFLRMLLFFGGAGLLGLGILFIKATAGGLKVVKRNKKHIWIQGVDQNLLAQLEDFAVSKR